MIIVRVIGGLGNQLFQYAAGKATAKRLGLELKLDTTRFEKERERSFLLPRFRIEVPEATAGEVAWYRSFRAWNALGIRSVSSFKERSLAHDERFLALGGSAYLSGYFQREEYFANVARELCDELVLRNEPEHVRRLSDRISGERSVCLHVRRGDYFGRDSTQRVFGVCTPDYYRRCIRHLRERHEGLSFWVFSDDLAWAKEHVTDDQSAFEFVDSNGADAPHLDLVLLSRGRHLALSNSSFSWWAAWLHDDRGDVLVPTRWNNTPELGAPSTRPQWLALDPDDADERAA